jgi:hypothetical protein
MNADMLKELMTQKIIFLILFDLVFQQRNMNKMANIARRIFGNSVQSSYFERFHWSILNSALTLQTAEHVVPCSVAVMLQNADMLKELMTQKIIFLILFDLVIK